MFEPLDNVDIYDYLKAIGVENPSRYFKYNTVEKDYNYDHIKEAIECFNKHKNNKSNIATLVDSDVDGAMSSCMLISFMREAYGLEITKFFHHKNPKAHGLADAEIVQQINLSDIDLLFVPDANANMKKKELLNSKGERVDIIVLDHHKNENKNENCIFVNNQFSPNVVNKDGSGTLVTWHFLHLLNPKIANTYISYVFISTLSDSMSLCSYENATFCHRGVKRIHENLKPFVDKFNKDTLFSSFSFGGIIPKFNSTIRLATREEKDKLFDCLSGKITDKDILEEVFKFCSHYHSFQNEESKRLMEESVSVEDLNDKVLLCKINEKTPLTGLVANKIQSKYNMPVLLLHDDINGHQCAGSARSPIPLKEILKESKLFSLVEGHSQACGIAYNSDNEDKIRDYLCSISLSEPSETVLKSLAVNSLSTKDIDLFEPYTELWGNDMTQPLYHIYNIKIKKSDISIIGRTKTTIVFNIGKWKFIKFFCSHDWIEENITNLPYKNLSINLIGTLQWNEFRGTKSPQVVVEKIEIESDDVSLDDIFS